jgi:hypothetical protein
MRFEVVRYRHESRSDVFPRVVLTPNTWDDYGWKTTFDAALFEERGLRPRVLGPLRILRRAVKETRLEAQFETLGAELCSLGSTPRYYRSLAEVGPATATTLLRALRDIAFDETIQRDFEGDRGVAKSLLRTQRAREAMAECRRLFRGEAPPRPDRIEFQFKTRIGDHDREIHIDLSRVRPLGRLAAVIGPNGSGKTRVFGRLAHALLGYVDEEHGEELHGAPLLPGGVIAISWSAFDRFQVPIVEDALSERYVYTGLRRFDPPVKARPEPGHPVLGNRYQRLDLTSAVERAWNARSKLDARGRRRVAGRLERMTAIEPRLARDLTHVEDVDAFSTSLARLSSGQQLLLFTVLQLEADLLPGTMVLFDEPESHLHPTLLSAFLREFHELLEHRDAFALVATHTPLVLQEIPQRQVSLLGAGANEPYDGETFGETVSRLMDYAFGVGGEERNWRAIVREYEESGRIGDLRHVFHEDLNLPLRGLLGTNRGQGE